MIDRVWVSWVNWSKEGSSGGDGGLSIKFNCLNAEGDLLPGLGGSLRQTHLEKRAHWKSATAPLVELLLSRGQEVIAAFDDYDNEGAEIVMVQVGRYGEYGEDHGHGINVEFIREGDVIPSSCLMEWGRLYGTWRHNQKQVVSEARAGMLHGVIEEIMALAEGVIWGVCAERPIRRKERAG